MVGSKPPGAGGLEPIPQSAFPLTPGLMIRPAVVRRPFPAAGDDPPILLHSIDQSLGPIQYALLFPGNRRGCPLGLPFCCRCAR